MVGSKSAIVAPAELERCSFVASCLLHFPLEALRRPQRERLLDACLPLDGASCAAVRPLVHRLWRLGNAGSRMATDFEAVRRWFCSQPPAATTTAADTLRRLLSHACANRDPHDKTRRFLAGLLAMASSTIDRLDAVARETEPESELEMDVELEMELELCGVVITELWPHRPEMAGCGGDGSGSLVQLRRRFLQHAPRRAASRLRHWRQVWELDRDDGRPAACQLAAALAAQTAAAWHRDPGGTTDGVAETIRLLCSVAESADDAVNVTALVLAALTQLPPAAAATDTNADADVDADADADAVLRHYAAAIARLGTATHRLVTCQVVDAAVSAPELGGPVWSLVTILTNDIQSSSPPLPSSLLPLTAVR